MKKSKKMIKILTIVCAVCLVFGLCAMSISAAASLSAGFSKKAVYKVGNGPAASSVTGIPNGDPDDIKYEELAPGLEKYELPVLKTTDSNYQFAGWSDNNGRQSLVGNDGKAYYTKENFNANEADTITFTALWQVIVKFDANLNDSSVTVSVPKEETIVQGDTLKFGSAHLATINTDDYTFAGWATSAQPVNGKAEYAYSNGNWNPASLTVNGPMTLYAVWKANFYTVTYYANTGSETTDAAVGVPVDKTKYSGSNLTAIIMGGGTAKASSGSSSNSSSSSDSNLNTSTSTATASSANLTVPTTTSATTSATVSASSSAEQSASATPSASSSDSDLNSSATPSASSSDSNLNSSTTPSANQNTQTNSDNSTAAPSVDNSATMTDKLMKRDGYAFQGWATSAEDANAGTVAYKVGQTVNLTGDLNLYAVWTSTTAPSTSTSQAASSKTPQTGDNEELYLYILMAVLSLIGIVYLVYDQKKKERA